ncbi:MAG: hypothetical protein ACE5E7_03650 [Anaerolineae bacterium]
MALLLWLALLVGGTAGLLAQAPEPNRAALVVVFAEGDPVQRCVEFDEKQISGYELLSRSGLAVEADVGGIGAAVCRIDATGCPGSDCFCSCKAGGPCEYWSYWHQVDGVWQYSQVGAHTYQIRDGQVEGWVWGPGAPNSAPSPPEVTFEEVCLVSPSMDELPPAVEQDGLSSTETADGAAVVTPAAAEPDPPANAGASTLGYGLLALIVVSLGAGLPLARRSRSR